jgi:hypothetical protein
MLLRLYDGMSKMVVFSRMLPFRVAPKKLWCQKQFVSAYM